MTYDGLLLNLPLKNYEGKYGSSSYDTKNGWNVTLAYCTITMSNINKQRNTTYVKNMAEFNDGAMAWNEKEIITK